MDQITLVNEQIMDGQRLVELLANEGFSVTAACWLKTSEDGQWFLYLASPVVDEEGPLKAYRRVHPLIRRMSNSCIDPFEVKLIGTNDPIAEALRGINCRSSARGLIPYSGAQLGGVSIEGAYFYPSTPDIPGE
jgi:hypothetical protein